MLSLLLSVAISRACATLSALPVRPRAHMKRQTRLPVSLCHCAPVLRPVRLPETAGLSEDCHWCFRHRGEPVPDAIEISVRVSHLRLRPTESQSREVED